MDKKQPRKIFGLMSKRRWFGVIVFLCGVLWSYCWGPDLEHAYINNRHFRNTVPYTHSLSDWSVEGPNKDIISQIFEDPWTSYTFFWQTGAFFKNVRFGTWNDSYLIFSDIEENNIYTFSFWEGTLQLTDGIDDLGAVAIDKHDNHHLYVAQPNKQKIIRFDTHQNVQHEVASVSHEIKHMIVNSDSKWIYFTNPSENQPGIYRVPTKGGHAELLANDLKRPTGLTFSSNGKQLYVTNCDKDGPQWAVYDVTSDNKLKLNKKINLKDIGYDSIHVNTQCIAYDIAVASNEIITMCPGRHLCFINEQTWKLDAKLRLVPGINPTDLTVGKEHLFLTNGVDVFSIRFRADV